MEPHAGKQSHRKCCGPSMALITKEEEGAKAKADGQSKGGQPEQQPDQIECGDAAEDDHQRHGRRPVGRADHDFDGVICPPLSTAIEPGQSRERRCPGPGWMRSAAKGIIFAHDRVGIAVELVERHH